MGTDVLLKSGEQTRQFNFSGQFVNPPVYSTAVAATSLPIYKESPHSTFQLIAAGTGAITATATIQCTNDDNSGKGYFGPGQNQPDYVTQISNGSATMTSPSGMFDQRLVGATIIAPGVPAGTTVSSVAAGGLTLTMSATATATTTNTQTRFLANNWNATALGTISLTAAPSADGFTTLAPWRYVRCVLSGITGGGLTGLTANMAV